MGETLQIKVPQELFAPAESSFFSGIYDLSVLSAGPDEYTFEAPLAWNITASNTGGALLLTGTIEGVAKTSCARCLDGFSIPLKGEIEGFYLLSSDEEAPEDMEDDEFEVLSEDNVIEIAPLLDAALLIELPLIPLCREDCKGLCPHCGIDLNEGECTCSHEGVETAEADDLNPFAVLKDFPFEK